MIREGETLKFPGLPRPWSQGARGRECQTRQVSGKDTRGRFELTKLKMGFFREAVCCPLSFLHRWASKGPSARLARPPPKGRLWPHTTPKPS